MKSGGYYTGQWYKRKPHGFGEYLFADTSKYVGEVKRYYINSGIMGMQVERESIIMLMEDTIKENFI